MTGDEPTAGRHEPDEDAASAASGRASLAAQLRQLEDFASRAASEGDSVPPQATEMIAHLREIVQALDGLTASMTERSTPHQTEPADSRDRPGRMEDDRP